MFLALIGTIKELHEGIMLGIDETIKDYKKLGEPIPPEDTKTNFNGKILLRISPEVHAKIFHEAKANKTSLNKYIESKLK